MPEQRLAWMDTLRGLAIALVILGHSVSVPIEHGFRSPDALVAMCSFFAPFRIPALLFLSGMLLERSLQKPWPAFLRGKWQLIAWPYLVWVCVRYIPEAGVKSPADPEVWLAAGYLWFLFYLLGYYLIALATRSVPAWLMPVVFVVATAFPRNSLTDFAYFGTFFFAGYALNALSPGLPWVNRKAVAIPAAVVGSGIGLGYAAGYVATGTSIVIPGVLSGIIAAVGIVRRGGTRWVLQPLQFAGRNSLVFYVAHFPVIAGLTTILAATVPAAGVWYWMISATAATLACWGLARLQSVRPVTWLFRAPGTARAPAVRW